jgi:NAD(P)-dependent dehydrogenase (short-subunit alcohol dehydrogenase family)
MSQLTALGITALQLDVTSSTSIAQCVSTVSSLTRGALEILINNAGHGLSMPITDTPLAAAQQVFDTNFFGALAVIQSFLPLLIASATTCRNPPMIVNNTSIVSVIPVPFQAVYNASKAALAALTDTLRLELAPFGVKVVDLKTGVVNSQFFANVQKVNGVSSTDQKQTHYPSIASTAKSDQFTPPKTSIYAPASKSLTHVVSHVDLQKIAMPVDKYAEKVVSDLLRRTNPPVQVWRGTNATIVWFGRRFLPFTAMDRNMRKMGRLNEIESEIRRNGVAEEKRKV